MDLLMEEEELVSEEIRKKDAKRTQTRSLINHLRREATRKAIEKLPNEFRAAEWKWNPYGFNYECD